MSVEKMLLRYIAENDTTEYDAVNSISEETGLHWDTVAYYLHKLYKGNLVAYETPTKRVKKRKREKVKYPMSDTKIHVTKYGKILLEIDELIK